MKSTRPLPSAARLIAPALLTFAVGAGSCGSPQPDGSDARFTREGILEIISEESPVYYRDGVTPLGVFFAREHRQYVPFEEIPEACVDAIVAAEDKRFFSHPGVDPLGIARAMWMNVKAGGLVAGGSTLTQQTAKNLYYRPDRSIKSKWTELQNALRLEANFSKQDILEFYFNQFHVSGNGRGLGIAARYFFDRDVDQLGLHECAFLAGMVKAPSRYNPWTGRDEDARQAARDAARVRTAYVLDRMVETGAITEPQYLELRDLPVPFQRGTFRYDRSVVLDAVERALAEEPFPEVFAEAGIDNPSAAGLQIVTTLDADIQTAATWGLWHHLSELGPYLDGADAAAFLASQDAREAGPLTQVPGLLDFVLADVRGARGEGAARALVLDLGPAPVSRDGGGRPTEHLTCTVDHEGLARAAAVVRRARERNPSRAARAEDIEALLAALPPGSTVRASMRAEGAGGLTCDLEARTELQGAVVVLRHGQVLALVGGNDNQNFNRALDAQRQFGSTWKPLVYHAALQLGWEPDDVLDNRRGVFPFEGTWYYPRPDHEPEPAVTLAWAGTRSENLASIWLLYHLVDHLNAEQLRQVAELTGLARGRGESQEAYVARIRDQYGVIALESRIPEVLFDDARRATLGELAFLGHPEDDFEVRSLFFGRGFEAERQRVRRSFSGDDRKQRTQALGRNFLRLETDGAICGDQLARLGTPVDLAVRDYDTGTLTAEDVGWLHLRTADGAVVCSEEALPGLEALGPSVGNPEAVAGWARRARIAGPGDLLVDGVLHLSTIEALRTALDAALAEHAAQDPWAPELLMRHPDMKRLLGMRYVALLARSLGVETDIPPVLSMPLGAAEISLAEVACLYQGFLEGSVWRFPGQVYTESGVPGLRSVRDLEAGTDATLLIQEIRDRDGAVLYRAREERVQVVDPAPGLLVADILANVVAWGTGRRAAGALELGGRPWPLMGKTGTTNAYRNAAFVGFLPVPGPHGLDPSQSYTIAAYVGYDDNRPMRRGALRASGASGALPAWTGTAVGMARLGVLVAPPTVVDPLAFPAPAGFERRAVDPADGLPAEPPVEPGATPTILAPAQGGSGPRRFAPLIPPAGIVWNGGWAGSESPLDEGPSEPVPEAGAVTVPEGGSVWDEIERTP